MSPSKYTERFKINQRSYDALYQWTIRPTIADNKKMLWWHAKSAQHQTVISNLQKMTIEELQSEDWGLEFNEVDNGRYVATMVYMKYDFIAISKTKHNTSHFLTK